MYRPHPLKKISTALTNYLPYKRKNQYEDINQIPFSHEWYLNQSSLWMWQQLDVTVCLASYCEEVHNEFNHNDPE